MDFFLNKNTLYAKNDDSLVVISLQKSDFNNCLYIEIGLYVPISNNFEFPKITDCQFRIRHLKNNTDAIEYNNETKETIIEIKDEISIFVMSNLKNIDSFKKYINDNKNLISVMYLEMKQYLNLE